MLFFSRKRFLFSFCLILLTLMSAAAVAQGATAPVPPPAPGGGELKLNGEVLKNAGLLLTNLFVVALLLESALALLFNWKPFVESLNARAVRPLISFALAMFVVNHFDYDLLSVFLNGALDGKAAGEKTGLGAAVTAAILAGGSAGVNTIMVKLGVREVKTPQTTAPKPSQTVAWIAIETTGQPVDGDIRVQIGPPQAEGDWKVPLAGVISKVSPGQTAWFWRFFLRPKGRFPVFGGFEAPVGQPCRIIVTALRNNAVIKKLPLGMENMVPAPGAIINLTVDLTRSDE